MSCLQPCSWFCCACVVLLWLVLWQWYCLLCCLNPWNSVQVSYNREMERGACKSVLAEGMREAAHLGGNLEDAHGCLLRTVSGWSVATLSQPGLLASPPPTQTGISSIMQAPCSKSRESQKVLCDIYLCLHSWGGEKHAHKPLLMKIRQCEQVVLKQSFSAPKLYFKSLQALLANVTVAEAVCTACDTQTGVKPSSWHFVVWESLSFWKTLR